MVENKTLMIVDDDPGIRTQIMWAVEGFDVITAQDRKNALEKLSQYHPAVVTLDLGMPPDVDGSKEGFATLKQILEEAPETKVVIVSGNDDPSNVQRAVDSGAFEFSAKPVNIENLVKVLERAYSAYKTLRKSNNNL